MNLYGNYYVISDMTLIPSQQKFSYSEDDNTRRENEAGVKLCTVFWLYGDELSKQLAVHIPVSCVFLKLLMFTVTTETVTHKTNSNHLQIQKIPREYTVSTVSQ